MAKKIEIETDVQPEAESIEAALMRKISTDRDNGIVVYTTTADDGTPFSLSVDGHIVHATAENNQVWFYAGYRLSEYPTLTLQ